MNRKSAVHRFSMMLAGILLSFALLFTMLPAAASAEGETVQAPTEGWATEVFDFTDTAIGAEEGWMYYFYSNGTGIVYNSDAAYFEVAEGEGVDGGNALHAVRKAGAPSEFVLYSRHVPVTAGKTYNISAQMKVIGEGVTVGITRNERRAGTTETDATETYPGFSSDYSVSDTDGEWQNVSFNFVAAAETAQAGVKMTFNGGIGEIYADNIMIREVTNAGEVPTVPYHAWRLYGWGKGVTDTGVEGSSSANEKWEQLTPNSLSSESSDNDGASLSLTGGMFVKSVFGPLAKRTEDTTYTLSFKYKGGDADSRIQIRMDGYTTDGTDFYWITGEGEAESTALSGAADEWSTFSYTFKARGGVNDVWKEIVFVTIGAFDGDYLIDEVSIVCNDEEDPMQYVQNGSFTTWLNIDERLTIMGTTSVAEQPDGSYVYTAGNQAPRGVGSSVNEANTTVGYGRGEFQIGMSTFPAGQRYKVSMEYRGGFTHSLLVFNGAWNETPEEVIKVVNSGRGDAKNDGWTKAESDYFTPKSLIDIYGDATNDYIGATQTYIRNIKITGEDGTVYEIENPSFSDFSVTPEPEYGANVFTYGDFDELTFPETDWELTGGARVRGFVHEYAETQQYRLALDGQSKVVTPAVAIAPAAENTFARVMFAFESEGDLNVTLLTEDDTVLQPLGEMQSAQGASVYGQFRIPAGTTALRVVIENTNEYYVSIRNIEDAGGGISLETHVHTFVADDDAEHPAKTEEATCQHGGTSSKYCSDCGEYVVLESTPKSDHHWSDWEVIEAATCVTTGRQQRTCEDCGEREIEITQPTGEHTYENGVCTVCGAEDPNAGTDPTPPGDEDPNEGTDPTPPGDNDGDGEGGGCSGAAAGAGAAIALPLLGAAVFAVVKRKRN